MQISLPFTTIRRLPFDLNIVGFSAVLFGLKVVLNHSTTGWSNVMGMQVGGELYHTDQGDRMNR